MRMPSNGEAARHPSDEGTYYIQSCSTIVSFTGTRSGNRNSEQASGAHTQEFDYSAFSVVRTVAPLCNFIPRISPRFDRIIIDRARFGSSIVRRIFRTRDKIVEFLSSTRAAALIATAARRYLSVMFVGIIMKRRPRIPRLAFRPVAMRHSVAIALKFIFSQWDTIWPGIHINVKISLLLLTSHVYRFASIFFFFV